MKKIVVVLFSAVLLTALLFSGCGTASDSKKETEGKDTKETFEIQITDDVQKIIDRGYLKVGCKTDVPEFGYYDEETNSYSGLEIDLAYYVAAKIFGVDYTKAKEQEIVQFTNVAVENRFQVLEKGDVDCLMATVTITDERQEKYAFSNPYHVDSVGLMVLSNTYATDDRNIVSSGITSITQLDGKRIGVPKNATTRKAFMDYTELNMISVNPIFMEFDTYDSLYQALKEKTIDAFAVDRSILSGYQDSDMIILKDKFASQPYGVCAQKECTGLVDVVNVVLKELDARGIALE